MIFLSSIKVILFPIQNLTSSMPRPGLFEWTRRKHLCACLERAWVHSMPFQNTKCEKLQGNTPQLSYYCRIHAKITLNKPVTYKMRTNPPLSLTHKIAVRIRRNIEKIVSSKKKKVKAYAI